MLKRWFLHTLAVIGASAIAQVLGLGFKANYSSAGEILVLLVGVAVLGFLNATLRPLLLLLSIPVLFLTLGAFALVINALVLMLAGSLGLGFHFTNEGFARFLTALVVGIIIAILNGILGSMFKGDEDDEDR